MHIQCNMYLSNTYLTGRCKQSNYICQPVILTASCVVCALILRKRLGQLRQLSCIQCYIATTPALLFLPTDIAHERDGQGAQVRLLLQGLLEARVEAGAAATFTERYLPGQRAGQLERGRYVRALPAEAVAGDGRLQRQRACRGVPVRRVQDSVSMRKTLRGGEARCDRRKRGQDAGVSTLSGVERYEQ